MGFVFSSAGAAWEEAYAAALEFLAREEGVLLLGPAIGDSGRAWLHDHSLSGGGVRFGNRIQPWGEWVKNRARAHALGQGKGFRILNSAAKREELRGACTRLAELGGFHHIGGIWEEERFFQGLLGCVDEARGAGLLAGDAIDLAATSLAGGADAVTREVYEDLWAVLKVYEARLSAENDVLLDEAALLRLALASSANDGPYFLLGFDRLNLLETELVQGLARGAEVSLPLALPEAQLRAALGETVSEIDHPALLALRGLLTGFSGERRLLPSPAVPETPPERRFLEAHSLSGEAFAAAALGRAALAGETRELRFVAPEDYFAERGVSLAFREELALPENFHPRRALEHPVARLFFHVLELKEKDFSLAHGLELAQLVSFTRNRFADVPSRAARAGVRKGLKDWKRKAAGDAVLQEFAALLERIDRLLPEKGRAEDFARVVEEVAEEVGIAELARRAPSATAERDAHAALAGVLRNAQMLAAHTRGEFTFSRWMAELKSALASGLVGEVLSLFPRVQLYTYGEWLPPAGENTLTVALGLNAGVGPRAGFQFYFEEAARRKLSELQLPTQVQEGLCFLDQVKRVALAGGTVLFSRPKHASDGKECEPSWVAGALPLVKSPWPEVPRESVAEPFRAVEEVKTGAPAIASFSASLFETYKECPFKAFAERVLGLEDKVQESSLDVSRLEEGSLVHKALELFYAKRGGKDIPDAAERDRVLAECVLEAGQGLKREYFKGNEALFENQLRRLGETLRDFVRLDAENYARFPFFSRLEAEKEVSGEIGGFPWKGKIDRVDYDETARRFVVTDYKIGANPPANKELAELKRFQLQLYSDAVASANPGWEPAGALYVSVTSGKRGNGMIRKEYNCKPGGPRADGKNGPKPGERKYFGVGGSSGALLDDEKFEDLRTRSRAEAARLAASIGAGDFPVTPLDEENSCKRCSVRPACRIRELRSPPRETLHRPAPAELLALLGAPAPPEEKGGKGRDFNPEQRDALDRRGSLVFIEASAGTGKTTVIVERIRLFLAERMEREAAHLAVERFAAISFTEKSAQELGARLASSLLADARFGPRLASQAQNQISTIHGFCRRILGDFPVEAGVSPLAAMLDQKGAELLVRETVEELFLFPPEEAAAPLEKVFKEFARAKTEDLLLKLLANRALHAGEVERFRAGSTEGIFSLEAARETLLALLTLADLLHAAYEAKKRARAVLDFNDLEALSLRVLEHEHARKYYREKLELLLVDEFQDTNSVQREIFERIARPGWSNLFVVGDAKQSIYRFRAADVSVFQNLRKEAEAKGNLVTLGRNYRSRSELVETANRITSAIFPAPGAEAPDFEAVAALAIPKPDHGGGRAALVEYGDSTEDLSASERRQLEATLVARLIAELRSREKPPESIAILLRKITGNEAFLRALTDAGIPYRVGSSSGFYGQSVITDSIALLRVLYGARNDLALLAFLRSPWGRVPDSRLLVIERRGERTLSLREKLTEADAPRLFAWERVSSHSSLASLLEQAHREYPMDRREQLQAAKLVSLVDKLENEARPRAEILELLSGWAGWDQENDASDDSVMPEPAARGTVQVMTVHASKGLEFDVTILADLCGKPNVDNAALRVVRGAGMVLKLESEEKSEPYTELGRANSARELAELKRLFYVATTRAKEEQYFFLPRWVEVAEPKKWSHCGHFLRAADLAGVVERVDGDRYLLKAPQRRAAAPAAQSAPWPAPPEFPRFRESSITEIAAFQFCPLFHRRKYVLNWDDRIVELWPKPPGSFKKMAFKAGQPKDPETVRVGKLLKKLKLEKKERGIALHRVLERVKNVTEGLELAPLWLLEAYEAQGANGSDARLAELIALDVELLRHFLTSPLGREVFDETAEAYPEISFEWNVGGVRLHGAMDRLIRKPGGEWIVVDYKSSILEESLDRYRFQVESYMAAVSARESAPGAGKEKSAPPVAGYLVDLYAAKEHLVRKDAHDAVSQLEKELRETAKNYTPAGTKPNLVDGAVASGEHCFSCPYSLHCEIGKPFVLA